MEKSLFEEELDPNDEQEKTVEENIIRLLRAWGPLRTGLGSIIFSIKRAFKDGFDEEISQINELVNLRKNK